jgi:hypothetical protein
MTFQIRRVVTGHDNEGKAVVQIDDVTTDPLESRPGARPFVVWTSEGFPIDNSTSDDASKRPVGAWLANGSLFRLVEFAPGVAPRNHRTSSLDYAVVMSGEIDLVLDDGLVCHLKAGDVLVQRGTVHDWVNNGDVPCLIAFVLIDAKPVTVGGRVLEAHG